MQALLQKILTIERPGNILRPFSVPRFKARFTNAPTFVPSYRLTPRRLRLLGSTGSQQSNNPNANLSTGFYLSTNSKRGFVMSRRIAIFAAPITLAVLIAGCSCFVEKQSRVAPARRDYER
jgi:hypothetical protein